MWTYHVGLLHTLLRFPSKWKLYNIVTKSPGVRGHRGKEINSGGSHNQILRLGYDSLNQFSVDPID